MAEAAVLTAVQILGNLLIEKVKFLQRVEGEVQWLKDELKRMQSFLKDATEKQAKDARLRNWISDIREVAQDAEDAIEMFVLKVENPRRSRRLLERCACFPTHVNHLNKVGEEIKSIRKRLQDIESSRPRYGIQDLGDGVDSTTRLENIEWQRWLAPWQKDKHLVGLDEDVEQLLQQSILNKNNGLSVAAIVGMGGIGKSTLAKKLYNHANVVNGFEWRAWVVVSSEFTPEDVIKQIMLQLTQDKKNLLHTIKELEESINDKLLLRQMLQEMLHKQLEGKKYFIVLDDVWERTHWEYLSSAFPDEEDQTSRLLFTSRNQVITKYHGYVHKMRLLNPDESWELLLKTAFLGKNDGRCPEELESIGREILEKCHGLPLAITVAGGLLVNEGVSKNGWEKVLKQIKNYHVETSEISANISTILELSYHNLPPRLKTCFLCLGFFREDAIIRARILVHKWIALGFISSEDVRPEETMEEVAMSYLDELINRNLVQVKDMNIFDRVKECQVHDLLRQLSINKAKEEIGLEILGEKGNSSKSSYKPRHLVYQCFNEGIMRDSSNQYKRIRSLVFYDDREGSKPGADIGDFLNKCISAGCFQLMRVLDLEGVFRPQLPEALGKLTLLRYLGLRWTFLEILPDFINKFLNLQVLDVKHTYISILPKSIWRMQYLRHLYLSENYRTGFDGWPADISMTYLQTLWGLVIDENTVVKEGLDTLVDIRKLGLSCRPSSSSEKSRMSEQLEAIKSWISKLDFLETLRLQSRNEKGTASDLHLSSLKQKTYLSTIYLVGTVQQSVVSEFPKSLISITLSGSKLAKDPMDFLGKLPNLHILRLLAESVDDTKMLCEQNSFPMLKVLQIWKLKHLEKWEAENDSLRSLEELEIRSCAKLENLPDQLQHVSTLKKLRLLDMPEGFVNALKEKKSAWKKIELVIEFDQEQL